MYTREEKKELRLNFWNQFNSYSGRKRRRKRMPPKWVGDKTGIKDLNLKFHFDENEAIVGIDITSKDLDRRVELYDRLESLKKLLHEALDEEMIWELEYTIESGKEISRVYFRMLDYNIYNTTHWPDVMVFFFNKMIRIEPLILEYKDYLKG